MSLPPGCSTAAGWRPPGCRRGHRQPARSVPAHGSRRCRRRCPPAGSTRRHQASRACGSWRRYRRHRRRQWCGLGCRASIRRCPCFPNWTHRPWLGPAGRAGTRRGRSARTRCRWRRCPKRRLRPRSKGHDSGQQMVPTESQRLHRITPFYFLLTLSDCTT